MTKTWKLLPPSSHAPQLAHEAGISLFQAQLLINRGITDSSAAMSFIRPRLSHLMNPLGLKDMDLAIQMIVAAIKNREKIAIYGDYDADGVTATALLLNFFSSLHIPVSFYVPNRMTEGYGLNPDAVEKIAQRGVGLVITVDCGTANRREIERAKEAGIQVVVTDHHQVPEGFEPVCPVVNPHRPGCPFPFRSLAGVGLAFFLAIALRGALREEGWFKDRPEPDLKPYLDLVALGTVADMVPLLDQNRIMVKWGIEVMKRSRWPGIRAIKEIAAVKDVEISPYDLAFKLAPRLNAPGRMGNPEMGVDVLTTDDLNRARQLAKEMNALNSARQATERGILDEIEELISSRGGLSARRTLVLSGLGWHRGVLGIVASRLVDRYNRPALVLDVQDGMAVGSGRSIDGFSLHRALARLDPLFERFGGHAHAVGFALEAAKIEHLARELEALAMEQLDQEDLIPKVQIDAEISLQELTPETLELMQTLAPFGPGNPEPVFCARSLRVVASRVVGERHLKLRVKQGTGVVEAIGFGLSDKHPLQGETIDMAFVPEINPWQGFERLQLRVVDLR